jgi:predicted flap endonuclease-1-like 5' DNA nuclease
MGLISAIRSVLGIGDSGGRSRDESTGTNVTVERETDATSERAVKESDATEVTFDDESGATTEEEPDQSPDEEPGEDAESEPINEDDAQDAKTTDEEAIEDEMSVEEIKGIGPTYAERLADAGVHTVSELAAADAAELGSETGAGEGRVATWIERASEY